MVLAAIGLSAIGVGAWRGMRADGPEASAESVTMAALMEAGERVRAGVGHGVKPAIERTRKLASNPEIIAAMKSGDGDVLKNLCNAAVLNATEVDAVAVFDKQGAIKAINTVYTTGEAIDPERVARIMGKSVAGREIIQSCVRNDSNGDALEFQTHCDITPAFFNSTGLAVAYSLPVRDPATGEKLGVVSSRMRFERLTELLGGGDDVASIFYVSDKGEYFSEDVSAIRSSQRVAPEDLKDIVVGLGKSSGDRTLVHLGERYLAVTRLSEFRTLDGGGINVMVVADQLVATIDQRQARMLQAGAFWLIGTLLVLLGLLLRYLFTLSESRRELVVANTAANAASKSKSEFLANMSHEIRTPMTAILGYTELLQEPGLAPAAGEQYIGVIRANGEHLLTIINDILDLSKIEAGSMSVERVACSPAGIVHEVQELMNVRAEGKGIELRVSVDDTVPACALTDPTRLRQILVNLVGNAIKFTEKGSVTLGCRAQPQGDGVRIEFAVTDTGVGMTPEQAARLFRPFTQADGGTTRKFGGTGLGLTIAKRLSLLLGGDTVIAKSAPGEGTTFVASIAAGVAADRGETPAHQPAQPAAPEATLDTVVLLAEDGPDNQRLISHLLRKAGAKMEIAANGVLAVEAVRKATAAGRPYGVILMDMQMPEMDGYEATRVLRREGYTGAIVALTASALIEDRDRCFAAGCDDFASKPIKRADLVGVVARWAGKRSARQTPAKLAA